MIDMLYDHNGLNLLYDSESIIKSKPLALYGLIQQITNIFDNIWQYFSYFFSENRFWHCQNMLSEKNKKNILKLICWNFYPEC